MITFTFNTGRAYSENGQEIKVTAADGVAYFTDFSRMIAGYIILDEWETPSERVVLSHYDAGNYRFWHGNHEAI